MRRRAEPRRRSASGALRAERMPARSSGRSSFPRSSRQASCRGRACTRSSTAGSTARSRSSPPRPAPARRRSSRPGPRARRGDLDVAWLSLDRDDNWAPRFWAGVERALTGRVRVRPAGEPVRRIVDLVTRRDRPVALVLDDFQELESRSVLTRGADADRPGAAAAAHRALDAGRPEAPPAPAPARRRAHAGPRRRPRAHARGDARAPRPGGGRADLRRGRDPANADRGLGRRHPARSAVARACATTRAVSYDASPATTGPSRTTCSARSSSGRHPTGRGSCSGRRCRTS